MTASDPATSPFGAPDLPPERLALLTEYRDRLLAASRVVNLISDRSAAEVDQRHIAESLAVLAAIERAGLLPVGARLIDVGSGGGLPGVPIAIARPDLNVTLLEATGKKAAFLRETAAALGLTRVRVLSMRAEEAAHVPAERAAYHLAVARAVAPLAALVELTLPFVRVGGVLAAVKGSRAAAESADAKSAIRQCGGGAVQELPLRGVAPELRLLMVPKRARTPAHLPRRPGLPAKQPLR
jgi:16S rRNA (guanine527-N7)-methyltransferase